MRQKISAAWLGTALCAACCLIPIAASHATDIPIPSWTLLSTSAGELPAANVGEQSSALILDVDRDGANDIVIAGWGKPSMIWYRIRGTGWDRYVIDVGT